MNSISWLNPFIVAGMRSHSRQGAFRRSVVAHTSIHLGLALLLLRDSRLSTIQFVAYFSIALAIIEGAFFLGWRLTQLPKSEAMEFMLVSPVQSHQFFFAEASVSFTRYVFIQLASLPIWIVVIQYGVLTTMDLPGLILIPLLWGAIIGFGLVVWAYETRTIRLIGQIVSLMAILIYLIVGVLAGERLGIWLNELPGEWSARIASTLMLMQQFNPFGVIKNYLDPRIPASLAMTSFLQLQLIGLGLLIAFWVRAACRLKGHFQDLHYFPLSNHRSEQTHLIGQYPLTWWTVKRVMNYSGEVNLWLAGGFCLIYSAYILAGDSWPRWLGVMAFQMIDRMGGPAILITGLVSMAAVPAAFQYGLWDPSAQDRCKRLELLLLTDLEGKDYWHAACQAAWKRGRGYLLVALLLWLALLHSGSLSFVQFLASLSSSAILIGFTFAVGFWCFRSGNQSNGIGSFLVLGVPILVFFMLRNPALSHFVSFLPQGGIYLALTSLPDFSWMLGQLFLAGVTILLTRHAIQTCEKSLRIWYDQHVGLKQANA
jgi:hypothetical protein